MTTPAPGTARAAVASAFTAICTACGLSGGPFEGDEATYFIGLHNDLHHGGSIPLEGA